MLLSDLKVGEGDGRSKKNMMGLILTFVVPVFAGIVVIWITTPKCSIGEGQPDFDGDGCIDTYSHPQPNTVRVFLDGKISVDTTPDHEFEFEGTGQLLVGDFNGDKRDDFAQIVTKGVDHPGYVHVLFSDKNNDGKFVFDEPRFDFVDISDPSYRGITGHWNANDFDKDNVTDLIHDSKRGKGKRYWKSNRDGTFLEVDQLNN